MIMLPELKKPSKLHYVFFAITAIWLVIVNIALFFINAEISGLTQAVDQSENVATMQSLQIRQVDLSAQLENIDGKFTDASAIAYAGLQALSNTVDQRFSQIKTDLQNIKPDLSAVYERLDQLDETVGQLSKSRESAPIVSAAKPSPKPAANTVKPQTPAALSFVLLGAELRGGEKLLSLSPTTSSVLSDVRLIRVGESVDGWTLQTFDGSHATFEKSGHSRKLTLP